MITAADASFAEAHGFKATGPASVTWYKPYHLEAEEGDRFFAVSPLGLSVYEQAKEADGFARLDGAIAGWGLPQYSEMNETLKRWLSKSDRLELLGVFSRLTLTPKNPADQQPPLFLSDGPEWF